MKNKLNISILSALVLCFCPSLVFGASISSNLVINGPYTTNSDSQFTISLNNFQAVSGNVSVLSISNSSVSDIKYAKFLDHSGWVTLTPSQSGQAVVAKFTSDTGFDVGGQRVITIRVNFKTPKTYVVGFSLQTSGGKILTSSAKPLIVTGTKILGENTTVTTTFARALKYGSKGADVTALQNKLTAEGFYSGPITGFFGRLTQAAVKKYQAAHSISPANGLVGPATLAALNQ